MTLSNDFAEKHDVTVGVIIPTYNRASLVTKTLDSMLGQTRAPDEVIVVNDGSSDSTEAVLQAYAGKIRYVYQSNAGKSAALNLALSMLDTQYVWIMDDDDLAAPDALERHLRFLHAHPEVDYTYGGVWCFSGDDPPPPVASCRLWQRSMIPHEMFLIRALEEFPCNQQTMLVPLACYHAVGPYDERQTFAEDYEMILRLARRFRAGLVQEPTVFLRQHTGDRGPAGERLAAAKRFEAWRPYEQRIFESLWENLPLVEYLPRQASARPLEPRHLRRALLQRACVMARHGVFEKALEDLEAAVAPSGDPVSSWSAEERRICGQMLNVEPILLDGQSSFLRQASRILRLHTPILHQAAAAGIGWSAASELRARRYRGAAQMSARLVRWMGPLGLSRMATIRLTRKLRQ